MAYKKSVTLNKSLRSMITAVAAVIITSGSIWVADKAHITIDPDTKTQLVLIVSTGLIGTIEALRNYVKHRKDKSL